jgi:hypothetical protein
MFLTLVLASASVLAQQSVPPPPKPVDDAPANAEVLKLLRAGMPESVVLDKIRATTYKFDTSADALVALKQAGATEAELKAVMAQGVAPATPAEQPPAAAPNPSSPTLAESLKFIQDMVNQQGSIAYSESVSNTSNGKDIGVAFQYSQEPQVTAIDPAGGLSFQEKVSLTMSVMGMNSNGTTTWQVNIKDIGNLEVMNSADYKHSYAQQFMYQDNPQFFELVIHLASGKTVHQHTQTTVCSRGILIPKQSCKDSQADNNVGVFTLHFRDEETADRVAKAMVHAIELCGGGSKTEPF